MDRTKVDEDLGFSGLDGRVAGTPVMTRVNFFEAWTEGTRGFLTRSRLDAATGEAASALPGRSAHGLVQLPQFERATG